MAGATPDNANPVIHTSAARRTRKRADSLDLSDDDEWARLGRNQDDEGELDDEQLEEIDGEEIFGQSACSDLAFSPSPARVNHTTGIELRGTLLPPVLISLASEDAMAPRTRVHLRRTSSAIRTFLNPAQRSRD